MYESDEAIYTEEYEYWIWVAVVEALNQGRNQQTDCQGNPMQDVGWQRLARRNHL